MKIRVTIVLFIFSILSVTAQNRIEVPGSRATILIPDGTITSPHYSAMTKPDVFEMSIVEFQGDLESKFREIDSAGYEQRGMKVYEEYEMTVDGYNGKVIHAYSNPAADVVQFLFGDSTFFIMASTLYTRGDKDLYNEILGCYKSIEIHETKDIDWDQFIGFTYDENNPFKLETEFINPMAIAFKEQSGSDSTRSYIMVQQFPNLGMFPDAMSFLSQFASSTVFQAYDIDEFISEGEVELNGKMVYEFSSYGINKKEERHLIQCVARVTNELAIFVCAVVMKQEDEEKANEFLKAIEFKN